LLSKEEAIILSSCWIFCSNSVRASFKYVWESFLSLRCFKSNCLLFRFWTS